MKCTICQGDFNDKCGAFTRHLIELHQITREEYVIISEHGGVAPICECGYCNETPEYYRGSFRKYSRGHNRFEWRNAKYIENYT